MICRPVSESSWPVGSSAISSCGPAGQRPGDGHPLLLAAGQLVRPLLRALVQADDAEQHPDPLVARPRLGPGDAQRDADVLRGGQHRDQAERLEDERDRPTGAARSRSRSVIAVTSCPATRTVPLGRVVQAADDVEQRGLAGAGPPAHRHELARAHGERDPAQRVHGGRPRGRTRWPRHRRATSTSGRGGPGRATVSHVRPCLQRRRARRCGRAGARPARRRCGRVPPPAGPGPACRAARSSRAAAAPGRPGRAPRTPPRRCAASPRSSAARRGAASRVLVRPSRIATVRPDLRRTPPGRGSTTSTVTPSSVLAVCSAANTSAAVAVSSSPVGSSASSTRGSFASAVAIAVRCCSPPDMRSGTRSAQCGDAERVRAARRPAARRSRRPVPLSRIGSSTFCRAGQVRQQVPGGLLPDEPDHAAPVGEPLPAGHRAEVVAGHPHRARRGRVQPGEDVHQGGLAAARRADHRGQLARRRPAGRAPAGPAPRCPSPA